MASRTPIVLLILEYLGPRGEGQLRRGPMVHQRRVSRCDLLQKQNDAKEIRDKVVEDAATEEDVEISPCITTTVTTRDVRVLRYRKVEVVKARERSDA